MIGKRGFSLVIVLFVSTIILLLGTAILNMSTSEFLMGRYFRDHTTAYYLAEGGLQKALAILKQNPNYKGNSTFHPLGEGYYKINISPYGDGIVEITSTGKVNKAEVSILAEVSLTTEIEGEVQLDILNWEYEGPI